MDLSVVPRADGLLSKEVYFVSLTRACVSGPHVHRPWVVSYPVPLAMPEHV